MTAKYPHCLRCSHPRDDHNGHGCTVPVTVGPFNGVCPCVRVMPAKEIQK